MAEHRYDPQEIEPRWQELWATRAHLGGLERQRRGRIRRRRRRGRAGERVLRARDAALPERRAAHRPPEGLLGRRRDRPLPPPHGPPRAAPDGLRRLRPAGGEPRDQDGRAPARLDGRVDRLLPAPVPPLGHLDRLVARARDARTRATTAGRSGSSWSCSEPGWPTARRRRSSGARKTRRCSPTSRSTRRALRALRRAGGGAPARAVVPADHRLRRAAAERPRRDRLARAREDDAAQLDRALARAPR